MGISSPSRADTPSASKPFRPIWTLLYFGTIVLSNLMLIWFAPIELLGAVIPPAIFASGFVFVLRDYAQRELGHSVLVAMFAAAVATYFLAGPAVALASASAFLVSELADWLVFTITRRPLAQRILVSSLVSVPVDTAVFFYALGILDSRSLVVGIGVKLIGTAIFWTYLTLKPQRIEQPA